MAIFHCYVSSPEGTLHFQEIRLGTQNSWSVMAVWGWEQLVVRVHKDFGAPAPGAVVGHIALHDLHGPPEIHRNHGVF